MRYPVSTLQFAWVNVFTQLLDFGPILLFPFLFMTVLLMGVVNFFEISLSLLAILIFFLTVILVVSIARLVINRRSGPILQLVILAVLLAISFAAAENRGIISQIFSESGFNKLHSYLQFLPSTAFVDMLYYLKIGDTSKFMISTFELLLMLLCCFLLYVYFLRIIGSERKTKKLHSARRRSARNIFLQLDVILRKLNSPGSDSLIAFMSKDLIYFLRSRRLLVWYFLFYAGAIILSISPFDSYFKCLLMTNFAVLTFVPLASNQFAFDGAGVKRYFLAPLSTRQVFVQKDAIVSSFVILLSFPIFSWAFLKANLPTVQFLTIVMIFLYNLTMAILLGNFFSIYYPMRVSLKGVTGQFNPCVVPPTFPPFFFPFRSSADHSYCLFKKTSHGFSYVSGRPVGISD